MRNTVWPSSCVTPAGTPNELDVQNEWEENTHNTYQDAVQVMGSDLVACSYASAVRLGLPSRLMI